MAKASKRTKRFVSSGKLKQQIQERHKHKAIKKKIESGKAKESAKTKGKGKAPAVAEEEDVEEEDGSEAGEEDGAPANVDDLLNADFLDSGSEASDDGDEGLDDEDDSDAEQDPAAHAAALKKLAESDPEFYKYLQENDKELLDFDAHAPLIPGMEAGDDEEDEEAAEAAALAEMEGEREAPVLTKEMLRGWQRGMIEHRSLRSLKRLLLAYRAAAYSSDVDTPDGAGKDEQFAYRIDSAAIFNKVVLTAFKYTPLVLAHHWQYKELPNGKFKLGASPNPALPKLVSSYLHTTLHLISHLPASTSEDAEEGGGILRAAVSEIGKVVPWIVGGRKGVKSLLKTLLELWSTSEDSVRIAAFLVIRKLAAAGDTTVLDLCLKGTYLTFVRTTRLTSVHTLPSINLMKNSASEIYALDLSASYQQAFGYIRQLAVLLRGAMKTMTKDAFKQVYNWQFVHCIDFWSLVLATTCDKEVARTRGEESELQPLIYPLVQVALGVLRLIPTSRYFPLRFHMLRSLLRLSQRTGTFIPLAPHMLDVLSSAEFKRKPKPSTLKPLDWEVHVRTPTAYPRTRVYHDGLTDELVFLLAEWHAGLSTNIAFPELVIPTIVLLKRYAKKAVSPRTTGAIKGLVEKLEAQRVWVEDKRKNVEFAPGERGEVDRFLEGFDVEKTPIGAHVRILRKARVQKQRTAAEVKDDDEESDEEEEEEAEEDEEMEEDEE